MVLILDKLGIMMVKTLFLELIPTILVLSSKWFFPFFYGFGSWVYKKHHWKILFKDSPSGGLFSIDIIYVEVDIQKELLEDVGFELLDFGNLEVLIYG